MKRENMKLEQYINLLKKRISELNNSVVKIDNNLLRYSLKEEYSRNISSYDQNVLGELGRALAIIDLIKNHKVPPPSIYLEDKSIVGSPSKRIDIKIDIDDTYEERKCIALVECKTSIHKITDSQFIDYFKRQLYNIAHSYANDKEKPYPLILITYEVQFIDKREVEILYRWFSYPEIKEIVKTRQISLDKIISKNSTFAYNTSPEVLGDRVYFRQKPLMENDLIDITKPDEFKKLLKERLHQRLREFGIVEDDAFHTIINLLLAKTYDEIINTNKEPDFQVRPEDYVNSHSFYNRIKNLLVNALIHLLGEDAREAENKEILVHEKKEKILLDIIPYLQRIKLRSLRFIGEDSVGDVFLDFMHSIFRQSRGLFFTHPNICRFVCKALNIQKVGEGLKKKEYKYILDPSCGSGTFLIEALRLIFKDCSIKDIEVNAPKILFGIDNEPNAVTLCKVNMVIHGDGSANIKKRDALDKLSSLPFPNIKNDTIEELNDACTYEIIKERWGFDFIITNPPFSLEIGGGYPHFVTNEFVPFKGFVTKASECFFIERWFQLLNPGGKIGVVLPASILDSAEYFNARLLLLSYFSIFAVIELPDFAFAPHAQQKTYLVFGKRRSLGDANKLFKLLKEKKFEDFIEIIKSEKILFYKAIDIGYVRIKKGKTVITKTTQGNDLSDELAHKISEMAEGRFPENSDEKLYIQTIEQIYEQDKNLNLTRIYYPIYPTMGGEFIILKNDWQIVTPEECKKEDLNEDFLFICETGDILENGGGILLPQLVENNKVFELEKNILIMSIFKKITLPQMLSAREVSTSKSRRILEKIKNNKFGKLIEGDIIIAPVRPYLKKIGVVTESATKFLFSKDFIVLRRKKPDLKESFSLFLSLIHDLNIKQLESLSSTGKSGYPKIKNKASILQIKFYKIEHSSKKIERLIEIYDNIYKEIFRKL